MDEEFSREVRERVTAAKSAEEAARLRSQQELARGREAWRAIGPELEALAQAVARAHAAQTHGCIDGTFVERTQQLVERRNAFGMKRSVMQTVESRRDVVCTAPHGSRFGDHANGINFSVKGPIMVVSTHRVRVGGMSEYRRERRLTTLQDHFGPMAAEQARSAIKATLMEYCVTHHLTL